MIVRCAHCGTTYSLTATQPLCPLPTCVTVTDSCPWEVDPDPDEGSYTSCLKPVTEVVVTSNPVGLFAGPVCTEHADHMRRSDGYVVVAVASLPVPSEAVSL